MFFYFLNYFGICLKNFNLLMITFVIICSLNITLLFVLYKSCYWAYCYDDENDDIEEEEETEDEVAEEEEFKEEVNSNFPLSGGGTPLGDI